MRISRTWLPGERSGRDITQAPENGMVHPPTMPPGGRHLSRSERAGHGSGAPGIAWPRPKSAMQLAHFVDGLAPTGGVGTGPAGHALARPCVADVLTAGALPSCRVVRRGDHQYYDPLRLPLRRARFHARLIRATSPRPGLRRRVSRVPPSSVSACCAPYPAEIPHAYASGPECVGHGLHRDGTGSALGL